MPVESLEEVLSFSLVVLNFTVFKRGEMVKSLGRFSGGLEGLLSDGPLCPLYRLRVVVESMGVRQDIYCITEDID